MTQEMLFSKYAEQYPLTVPQEAVENELQRASPLPGVGLPPAALPFFCSAPPAEKGAPQILSASHIGCAVFPQGSAAEAHFLRLPAERSADIVPRILKITSPA